MIITLPGRPPGKKNPKRIVRFGNRPGLISSEKYLAWRQEMALRIRRQRPKKPIELARVFIAFFPENRRRFDLSNSAESVMDLLVDEGFLADDSAFHVPDLHLVLGELSKAARTEIHIHSLASHQP